MTRAHTGQAARNDLAALGDKTLQQANVTVRDRIDLLRAELADLLASEELTATRAAARTTSGTGPTRRSARTGVRARRCRARSVLLLLRSAVCFVSHSVSLSSALCLRPAPDSLWNL